MIKKLIVDDLSAARSEMTELIKHLNYKASINHVEIKKSATHLDNQKFIQSKMQGKRRIY